MVCSIRSLPWNTNIKLPQNTSRNYTIKTTSSVDTTGSHVTKHAEIYLHSHYILFYT